MKTITDWHVELCIARSKSDIRRAERKVIRAIRNEAFDAAIEAINELPWVMYTYLIDRIIAIKAIEELKEKQCVIT